MLYRMVERMMAKVIRRLASVAFGLGSSLQQGGARTLQAPVRLSSCTRVYWRHSGREMEVGGDGRWDCRRRNPRPRLSLRAVIRTDAACTRPRAPSADW